MECGTVQCTVQRVYALRCGVQISLDLVTLLALEGVTTERRLASWVSPFRGTPSKLSSGEVSRRLGARRKQVRSCRMSGETEGRRPGQASRPLEELPECRETFSAAYADAVGKPMLIREALC